MTCCGAGFFFFKHEDLGNLGPHLSSQIRTDLFINRLYTRLREKFGIHENPEKHP